MAETVRLYAHIAFARMRSDAQYRTSFVVYLLAQVLTTAADLVALWALFQRTDSLGGWSAREVLYLYAVSMAAFVLADATISAVEYTGEYVRTGDLDRLLVRPVSPLLHLTAEQFALRRIGRVLLACALLAVVLPTTPIDWTPVKVLLTVASIAGGTVLFSGLFVLTASIGFWLVTAREAANAFTYGSNLMTSYPMHIFGEWLRRTALFLIPVGSVAYLPGLFVLEAENPLDIPRWAQLASPLAAVPVVAAAALVWRTGRRHYTSTGS